MQSLPSGMMSVLCIYVEHGVIGDDDSWYLNYGRYMKKQGGLGIIENKYGQGD